MPSERRTKKLETLIKEEISALIDRGVDFPGGSLVTITRVALSSDGRYADVFFSVYGAGQDEALEIAQKNVYTLQQKLNRRLGIRPVPRIRFSLDRGEERREGVEKSLADARRRGEL